MVELKSVLEEPDKKTSQTQLVTFIGPSGKEDTLYKSGTTPWSYRMELACREIKRLVIGAIDSFVMDVQGAASGPNPLYLLPDASKHAAGLGLFPDAARPRPEERVAYAADRNRLARAALAPISRPREEGFGKETIAEGARARESRQARRPSTSADSPQIEDWPSRSG